MFGGERSYSRTAIDNMFFAVFFHKNAADHRNALCRNAIALLIGGDTIYAEKAGYSVLFET